MKSFNIMPGVDVYQDIFTKEQCELFLDIIKKSETDINEYNITTSEKSAYKDEHGIQPFPKNKYSIINSWTPWYEYGSKSTFNNFNKYIDEEYDNTLEYNFRESVFKIVEKINKDYITKWKNHLNFNQYNIDWSHGLENDLSLSPIEILKHNISPEKEYALQFHTDFHEHRVDMPGTKQIVTYTIYLNDDYEGGEIEFINESENKLITYKPKFGDMTVFPAGRPYWHSARAVTSGSHKIFLRLFVNYLYPGSKEWNENLIKYGEEEWNLIHSMKIKEIVDNGEVGRQIVKEGNMPKQGNNLLSIYIKNEDHDYIDGRETNGQ